MRIRVAEPQHRYSVTVTVDDGETRTTTCESCTQSVSITVGDVNEHPAAPVAPTVVSGEDQAGTNDIDESTTSLKVIWHAPENTGEAINDYNVEYKKSTDTTFVDTDVSHSGTNTNAEITGLEADTSYDVRVRATNNDLSNNDGPWSLVGTGSTNKEGNSSPSFSESSPASRRVDENTPAGRNIEGPVTASDGDSVNLTYWLEGADADLFGFDTRTGQIRTKTILNHEDSECGYDAADESTNSPTSCSYNVTVTVSDGAGGSDATAVSYHGQ